MSLSTPHPYGFSATTIGDLGAAEYTLVTIAADASASVEPFARDIERCVQEVVVACRHSPRSDNLLLRCTSFNRSVDELHGFRLLSECDLADYGGRLHPAGTTALNDAAATAIEATAHYGRTLRDHAFDVNGLVVVITDGCENASRRSMRAVAGALAEARRSEALESLLTILVGVDVATGDVGTTLGRWSRATGFDRYLELAQADAATLASLAQFVVRSIAAQSLALGTGRAASPSLSF